MGIIILGLGCAEHADPAYIRVVKNCDTVFLQTDRYLAFREIFDAVGGEYLDEIYNSAETFERLNAMVADRLLQAGREKTAALCVAGDGVFDNAAAVAAASAARKEGIPVKILPGVSLAGAALASAGVMPADGYRVTTDLGKERLTANSGAVLVIPEINGPIRAAEAKIALMEAYGDDHTVCLVDPLSGREAATFPLYELDRQAGWTPFATLVVPAVPLEEKRRFSMEDLMEVCRILRSPEGCPWDREQTHESLRRNLLEETYEVLGALHEGEPTHIAEEFGDLLLQIALHAVIGEEFGEYDVTDVATAICEKMIRRHPHVFGAIKVDSTDEVLDNWEEIKRKERGQQREKSYLADAGKGLPPLKMAEEIQKKAARWGFDWEDCLPAVDKVKEELNELVEAHRAGDEAAAQMEAGDLLFACVNVIRLMGLDADTGLFGTCEKFKRRFLAMESMAEDQGKNLKELSLCEMDALWNRVKTHEIEEKQAQFSKEA